MNKNIKIIRKCITARHGGLESAPDSEILTVWNALTPADQKKYLDQYDHQLDRKETTDAPVD
ncbi:MAG: hypothetical protein BWY71_00132 [Planctomycetes bacterium ADurb.Bin412]|nr:MAG: hypothetical protein BWY71_00132 [Planctomycetes bacterium ADurb.Bin412]